MKRSEKVHRTLNDTAITVPPSSLQPLLSVSLSLSLSRRLVSLSCTVKHHAMVVLPVSRSVSGIFSHSLKKKRKRNSGKSLVVFLGFHIKKRKERDTCLPCYASATTRHYHNKTKPLKPKCS
ncbi:hypothetical protein HanXRQr2_Chr06g0250451 [Helianthus annuus]|uniref:Uncharacterized protein n=1 Tax=Helianthus annuus TaxID=4232 RepID=A0A9K3IRE0_HELAN|nr:hypothetical protein HanXRQr2_Chr06g0250451 [Helianthus annuus]